MRLRSVPPPTVYRCMVWFLNSNDKRTGKATPSLAYGEHPEREQLRDAMADLVVLKMTSMKMSPPDGNFFANVVEYPKGSPPKTMHRDVWLQMGGE